LHTQKPICYYFRPKRIIRIAQKDTEMQTSAELFIEAQEHLVGGVNSPVRSFRGVGGEPVFIERGQGPYLYDVEGKRYVDYVGAWGPMLLGHNHPQVTTALAAALENGLGFGTATAIETQLAKKIKHCMPNIELMRLVSSGTEATMTAIRVARGFTGRNKIIKFAGCYHGHADHLLVQAGSGGLTFGVPSSAGVPASFTEHTLIAEYNNLESVTAWFEQHGQDIAAIMIEPVAGNMNCIPPVAGFLEGLRAVCDHYGSLLIFDEVMTGFRINLGGATERYGIKADLYTLGKIIGGGLPVGALGGRREVMSCLAPLGPVYQAGTQAGNPLAMTAGLATLDVITSDPNFYEHLARNTYELTQGLAQIAKEHGVPLFTQAVGGMFGLFFTAEQSITRLTQVQACDVPGFNRFFKAMLAAGVYLAPSAFEAGFVSSAHQAADLQFTLAAADKILADW